MSNTVDKTLRLDRTQLGQKRPPNKPPTLMWAIIAGLAAAAVILVMMMKGQVGSTNPPPPPAVKMVTVVTAAHDIPARTTLTLEMVKTSQVAENELHQGAYTIPNDAVGKVTVANITNGDQLTSSVAIPQPPVLAVTVPKGMRAITIAVDPVSSVAGFIKPGDHVDVLGTFTGPNNKTLTRTILQSVEVLAAGSQTLPSAPTPPDAQVATDNQPKPADVSGAQPVQVSTATLITSPVDAEKLVLAAAKGKLQLALRYPTDLPEVDAPDVSASAVTHMNDMASVPAPARVAPPPAPAPPTGNIGVLPPPAPADTVTVIKGSDAHTVTING